MWEAAKRAGRVVEERDGRRTTRSSTQHHTEHPDISLCSRPIGPIQPGHHSEARPRDPNGQNARAPAAGARSQLRWVLT